MGFNYGLEKKNFDRQWAIMRKQYEDAGMSMEEICFSHLHRLQRQVQKRRAADEILTFTGIPRIIK